MGTVFHNKLVRDRIPEIIHKAGKTPVTAKIPDEEMPAALRKKLTEEVSELLSADGPREICEETADVLEVLEALCAREGVAWADVLALRARKREKRGGFEDGICLISVSDPEE